MKLGDEVVYIDKNGYQHDGIVIRPGPNIDLGVIQTIWYEGHSYAALAPPETVRHVHNVHKQENATDKGCWRLKE